MKLAHYYHKGKVRTGIVNGQSLRDLEEVARSLGDSSLNPGETIDGIIGRGLLESVRKLSGKAGNVVSLPLDGLKLARPILNPEKILCVAVNYRKHGDEGKTDLPSEPYFFAKLKNTLIDPGEPIIIPSISKKVDWEVELAVVIGKEGKYISHDAALDYVAGYMVSNDVSFRDLQFPSGPPTKPNPLGHNWVKGKSLDTAFPTGPWLVTRDEIADPQRLHLSLKVNGKVRQDSSTADMVHDVGRLVESASAGITLRPGDIISTGTPAGVAAFTDEQYLKDGDFIEGEVEGIGVLRNPVRSE